MFMFSKHKIIHLTRSLTYSNEILKVQIFLEFFQIYLKQYTGPSRKIYLLIVRSNFDFGLRKEVLFFLDQQIWLQITPEKYQRSNPPSEDRDFYDSQKDIAEVLKVLPKRHIVHILINNTLLNCLLMCFGGTFLTKLFK